jgi:hypothetical protein
MEIGLIEGDLKGMGLRGGMGGDEVLQGGGGE